MITTIIFDLGGVVLTLDQPQAVRRFEKLGLTSAAEMLNPYTQLGVFGQLEEGLVDAETFRQEVSRMAGHPVTLGECCHAMQGYAKELPQRNLDTLLKLRQQGYRVVLLSNTNPFMMEWAMSSQFDGHGHSISHYFDALYLSYQMKMMKPSTEIFHAVLAAEQVVPSQCLYLDDGARNVAAASQIGINTYCPVNGEDWTQPLYDCLENLK